MRFWPYASAIRDRLFSYFRLNETHEGPKLVALASFKEGSGTSTLSRSLAAMSIASGEEVLLIDLTAKRHDPNSIHQVERKLRGVSDSVITGQSQRIDDNNSGLVTPRDLYNVLPLIRESHYGYVIFDMPPLDSTSPTNSMAGFMDIVLLVVDATQTERDVVKRGYDDLVKLNAHVTCIYNKALVLGPGEKPNLVPASSR